MHVTHAHPLMSENQIHCARLYTCISSGQGLLSEDVDVLTTVVHGRSSYVNCCACVHAGLLNNTRHSLGRFGKKCEQTSGPCQLFVRYRNRTTPGWGKAWTVYSSSDLAQEPWEVSETNLVNFDIVEISTGSLVPGLPIPIDTIDDNEFL